MRSMFELSRRDVLKIALANTAMSAVPRAAQANVNLPDYPFTLGVASGSPRHDGMVLWTRLCSISIWGSNKIPQQPITVRWQVAHDDNFTQIVAQGSTNALPEMGHSVHIEVQGLASNRWYFYRFMQGSHQSPVGRTRTFEQAGQVVNQLRFAYASCQRWEHGYYTAYQHMAKEQLDAVLFLGDYIYEYKTKQKTAVRFLPNYVPDFAESVDDYRFRYAAYKSDPHLQAMHALCPWILTWDDHEVYNDYAKDQGEDLSPKFMQRRAAAYQAYYEHMPLRASTLIAGFDQLKHNAELRIYGSFQMGNLAKFHVLDDRQYRDYQACPKPNWGGARVVRARECESLFDPQRTLLGAQQEAWLYESLQGSNAQWNLISQQTLFGQRNYSPNRDPAQALLLNDGWDGYPAARQRLTQQIQASKVSNPIFIGGDIHQNWVGHVKANVNKPKSATIAAEFCGTSISSDGGTDDKLPDLLAQNPHYLFAQASKRGYGVVDINAKQLQVSLRVLDTVRDLDSPISTIAQFNVQSGSPNIERA